MVYTAEIFLTKKDVTKEEWHDFIDIVSRYNGYLKKWKIIIQFEGNSIHYYVRTSCLLPSSINGQKSFLLKECDFIDKPRFLFPHLLFVPSKSNAIDIYNYITMRQKKLNFIELSFRKIFNEKILSKVRINITENKRMKSYKLLFTVPAMLLSINFEGNYNVVFKSAPKYLDISKSMHLLKSESVNSILKVDTFPYLQGDYFLDLINVNFAKHSIIFGASGCGKSKFISSLIYNIYKNDLLRLKYKVVVIDPHASLEEDIGGFGRVIDFRSEIDSVNLFSNNNDDVIVSVELLLDVFRGLIPNGYNSKLERVLRHSIYLLLIGNKFNFSNLRKLLLESEYRSNLIREFKNLLPTSIIEFFLSEFNDIKTKSYTEAISPIIAFIDEMEMIPVFNLPTVQNNLKEIIQENFLTIFSLARTKLGDRVTKTISGLVMQQLLTLVQNDSFAEHIIFIVDEVATIENPILNRFLSEARKYNLSLILAGQYFSGITEQLKKSIFANVVNYYMFRVSKDDANILVDNFNMKVPLNDIKEQKIKIITELQDRECLVRINSNGILLPAIKCKTLNYISIPRVRKDVNNTDCIRLQTEKKYTKFNNASNVNLKDILLSTSTSRKGVKDE